MPTGRAPRLPLWHDPLIGRESALAALQALLHGRRLLTVLGTGGLGKTRLALAAAQAVVESQHDSIAWVDLAGLDDPTRIGPAIALAFELQTPPLEGAAAAHRLGEALAGRDALLVLDNAEHLVDSLAPLVDELLRSAPALRVLVTSQRLLGLPGEQAFRLEPLALPAPGSALAELRSSPAVQLLLRRARLAQAGFDIDDAAVPLAADLCRRLDGLPLAIEMAAARLPELGLAELNDRLGERLRMLGNANDALLQPRQRTLRAALDWSHALLTPTEQAVLRRLSVFAAPFRLAAAQRVAALGAGDGTDAVLAVLGLADKSLLQVQRGSPPRYRLLESTRLYAAQQLEQHAETAAARRCHADAMARLADEAVAAYWQRPDRDWLDAWQAEYTDWLAAFDDAAARGDAGAAAPLSEALHHLAAVNGQFAEIRRRLPRAVELAQGAAPVARAVLLNRVGIGTVPGWSRVEAAQQRVAAWRAVDDPAGLCRALAHLAMMCEWADDPAAADAALAEARALDDPRWPPRLRALGAPLAAPRIAARRQDAAGVREGSLAWLEFGRAAGARRMAAQARFDLGVAAQLAGHGAEAVAHMDEAIAEFRALGLEVDVGICLGLQCGALLGAGQALRARDVAEQALLLAAADEDAIRFMIDALAVLACRLERPADAARMLGASEALRTRLKQPRNIVDEGLAGEAEASLAAMGTAETIEAWRAEGRRLDPAGTRAAALAWLHAAG